MIGITIAIVTLDSIFYTIIVNVHILYCSSKYLDVHVLDFSYLNSLFLYSASTSCNLCIHILWLSQYSYIKQVVLVHFVNSVCHPQILIIYYISNFMHLKIKQLGTKCTAL